MTTNTLLDMTQEILSALSSDEVNSIGDTTESMQVATIIKRKTLDIWARSSTPERDQLIQLVPSNDIAIPVMMTIPDEVSKVQWIKYFDTAIPDTDDTTTPGYLYVTILPIQQFIDYVNRFNITDTAVDSFTFTDAVNSYPGSYTFYYYNERQPRYCTIINNLYVIFDAYDSALDDTLQASKTMGFGQVNPTFIMEDDYVPRLTEQQSALLLNEAKALAFFELKQTSHPKAEQEIQRQWSTLQKDKAIEGFSYFNALPNFGRK